MKIDYIINNISHCIWAAYRQRRFTILQLLFHSLKLMRGYLEIPFIEYAVTTRCTLKCKKCSNLIPHFKYREELGLEEVKDSIENLFRYVDYIYRFKIHGGEPLLYTRLPELLEWIVKIDEIGEIHISTNGTVIPDEKLLKAMKHPKIELFLSDYPLEIAPQKSAVLRVLKDGGIRTHYMKGQVWYDTGSCEKRSITPGVLKKQIRRCLMAGGKSLKNNCFYLCSRCANGEALGYFAEEAKVKLEGDREKVREALKNMYVLKECTGCRHCDSVGEKGHEIPPAEQCDEKL